MKDNTAAVHAQVPVDVATFLLNEKRVDLQLLEARHRVNVLLIPNVHLQTPNYTVARLRHDDLNQSEPLAPSYEMVQLPAEEEKGAAGTDPVTPRPEAAVKGITPMQPAPTPAAPVAAPAAAAAPALPASGEEGIIGKIMGWFRRKPATESSAAAAEPARAAPRPSGRNGSSGGNDRGRGGRPQRGERSAGSGGRGERHERGERGRGQRGQRGERPEREAGEPRAENNQRRGRGEGRGEQRRDSRPERDPSAQPQAEVQAQQNLLPVDAPGAVNEAPLPAPVGEQAGEERSGGRRRRGRRGGADRNGEARAEGGQPQQQRGDRVWYPRTPFVPGPDVATAVPNALFTPAEETVKETLQTTAPLAEMPATPLVPAPEPVAPTLAADQPAAREVVPPAPPAEPAVSPVPAVEVRQIQPAAAAAPAPVPAPAPVKLDWPSDLQQVETSRDRLQAALQNADDGAPRRIKRVRPPVEQVSNEPLQQVETRG